jgi:tRNA G10  N-methylase Trm11
VLGLLVGVGGILLAGHLIGVLGLALVSIRLRMVSSIES